MSRRRKTTVVALLVAAAVLTTGTGLFYNGYGPMALRDRRLTGHSSAGEAEARINTALRTMMDGISPALTYAGGHYWVDREQDHWDGEPSLVSNVTARVGARNVIAVAKLPVLFDQVRRAWPNCGEPEKYADSYPSGHRWVRLSCGSGGAPLLTLTARGPRAEDAPYDGVAFEASLFGVRYRPEQEYGPMPPLANRSPGSTGAAGNDPVDDPYWSH
ncbi:hypothetical protein OH807_24615 [Kitasatospora sp. NBC_01560]|uniref:hypothetical protein n=1 Tax=Kitasatospora sp. NBC_01560 TaxID=2975965 RepID=UPI00386C0F90